MQQQSAATAPARRASSEPLRLADQRQRPATTRLPLDGKEGVKGWGPSGDHTRITPGTNRRSANSLRERETRSALGVSVNAPSWGSRGRGFESRRPDDFSNGLGTNLGPGPFSSGVEVSTERLPRIGDGPVVRVEIPLCGGQRAVASDLPLARGPGCRRRPSRSAPCAAGRAVGGSRSPER
jgi:hypothetical protein